MRATGKLARCPACDPPMTEERGSGRCAHCHGQGKIPLGIVAGAVPCPVCKGTKVCQECLSVGNIALARANELFGLEPITRRDTPSALELAKADEAHDTERSPPPRSDPRRDPDD